MSSRAQTKPASDLDIQVVEKEIGPVLEIEHRASILSMPKHMGSGFAAIDRYMRSQGTEPQDPPFARYPEIDWERELHAEGPIAFLRMFFKKWHFFTGFPCPLPLKGEGEIRANKLGRRRYVSCLHVGPYRAVGRAYAAMYDFARANGLEVEPWCLEMYLNDPRESGQAKAETVCLIPVR